MHNKLWYGVESISISHSASSQLSGEFMLLHSIHTFANLALKETVPSQSRTSPHVTVKNTANPGQAQIAQKSWMWQVHWKQWKISGWILFFRVSAELLKNLEWQEIYSKQWKCCGKTLFFKASASCSKFLNSENIFNAVYWVYITISLGLIRVIWASVVCNLG